MIDGATDLVYAQDELFYNVNASIDEALNFYHARMIEKGWSLTNESRIETTSTATLEFSKGNAGVVVGIVAQGESVSVTINKK